MSTDREIARWRLRTQLLDAPASSAVEVVRHLLCVQAENASQSAWAVACRTSAPDASDLDRLLTDGTVVRTHVLRPTWHYALAEDVCWLIDVTAPRIRTSVLSQLESAHGISPADAGRRVAAVLELLSDDKHPTRPELSSALTHRGLETSGAGLMVLLLLMELDQQIVSGAPREGTHTYGLFDDRVRQPRRLTREEGLAELARRYVAGHGPVTERDLAYWASLTLGDARLGLAAAAGEHEHFEHDGRTYWHRGTPPTTGSGHRAHLLQILDEMYRGYQDSRRVLDPDGIVPNGRETAIGMTLLDGELVAGMKRTLSPTSVRFELSPHKGLAAQEVKAIQDAADRYADFLGRRAEVTGLG